MLQYIFSLKTTCFRFIPEFKVTYKDSQSESDAGLYQQTIFHQQSQSSSDIEKKYICNICYITFDILYQMLGNTCFKCNLFFLQKITFQYFFLLFQS